MRRQVLIREIFIWTSRSLYISYKKKSFCSLKLVCIGIRLNDQRLPINLILISMFNHVGCFSNIIINQKRIPETKINKTGFRLFLRDIFIILCTSIEFPPFCLFLFLLLYFFHLLISYIWRESPKRTASFGIFTFNNKCSLKCFKV